MALYQARIKLDQSLDLENCNFLIVIPITSYSSSKTWTEIRTDIMWTRAGGTRIKNGARVDRMDCENVLLVSVSENQNGRLYPDSNLHLV